MKFSPRLRVDQSGSPTRVVRLLKVCNPVGLNLLLLRRLRVVVDSDGDDEEEAQLDF